MCPSRRHPKSNSGLSYVLIALFLAGCSGGTTQPTVVVGGSSGGVLACDETVVGQDAYESATNLARCEHPDMLVHPRAWILRRMPSPPDVARFALEHDGSAQCSYDVARDGKTKRVP